MIKKRKGERATDPEFQKTRRLHIALTDAELESFRAAAEGKGIKMAALARRAVRKEIRAYDRYLENKRIERLQRERYELKKELAEREAE